jgi:hypothetical protein
MTTDTALDKKLVVQKETVSRPVAASDTYVSTRQAVPFTAPLISALDRVWAEIHAWQPDVPTVVMTVCAGSIGAAPGTLKLGHFAAGRWQHDADRLSELFIGGEGLKDGPVNVLGTLLHEAAHGLARIRGIKDTSRQGRFHNTRYKKLALELGLDVAATGSIGWSATSVPDTTVIEYAHQLDELATVLTAWRHREADPGGRTSRNSGLSATCECGRRIRVSPSTYQAGPIICGLCDTEFTA